ncbi:hypothetical protein KL905_000310 [Ogataea polymorpha]|uniref:Thiamine pyrophosphokinase n=1 Tax=Ogataea polymorpha TaxID=460523 RepID=A0A9P8P1F8_9ASCO|nr:hypothetical protein KL936_001663 [Ogataea polymorpha]KAG7911567.1 hypothetical protein KL906_000888 [Ogataea polymorpha]KAG7919213.1 hypothetical protein KL927_001342 [Ogataea polymorpha]KAG7924156.1 hypothetical protein KL905_000310 [Ogataea polymorpha]KAG7937229.1 hypothetical protein KL934_001432 [Ogataea polymorpha]
MGSTPPADNLVTENPDHVHIMPPDDARVICPTDYFSGPGKKVLLLLNQEIKLPVAAVQQVWDASQLRICADGGANQLYEYSLKYGLDWLPDFVIGDLDSLRPEVSIFYKSKGVKIKQQSSQYYSDLDKAITLSNLVLLNPAINLDDYDDYDGVSKHEESIADSIQEKVSVFMMGSIGGRFDHTVSTISKLIKLHRTKPNFQFIVRNSEYNEYILFIPKGRNFVTLLQEKEYHQGEKLVKGKLPLVGLLPLARPVRLSTSGLKWDVTNWESSIEGKVSANNLLVGDNGFLVDTTGPIFVNIEI